MQHLPMSSQDEYRLCVPREPGVPFHGAKYNLAMIGLSSSICLLQQSQKVNLANDLSPKCIGLLLDLGDKIGL
jgi:hypothetical protein